MGPAFQEEQTESKLRTTLINALKRAEEKGVHQIALPLMGVGFYAIPLATSSQVMMATLEEYLSQGSSLNEIYICANDAREYRAFQKAFESAPGESIGA